MEAKEQDDWRNILQVFSETVRTLPNNTAITIQDVHGKVFRHTYGELWQLSDQIAAGIAAKLGASYISTHTPLLLGVCLPKSLLLYATILAIWKIGATYVPISPHLTDDEIKYRCHHSGIKYLISNDDLFTTLFNIEPILTLLSIQHLQKTKKNSEYPKGELNPSTLAYIIFTTGTTAPAKGVAINHANIVNTWKSLQDQFQLTHADVIWQFADIRVDVHLYEIWLTFGVGATLFASQKHIDEIVFNIPQMIQNFKVTMITWPPTLLASVKELYADTEDQLKDVLHSLTTVVAATEELTAEVANWWLQFCKQFYNGYGHTETTIGSTIKRYAQDTNHQNLVAIGSMTQPFAGLRFHLVDEERKFINSGFGELVIQGQGLARGYWLNGQIDQELTNTAFQTLVDPGTNHSIRYFYSGDKVYVSESNQLYFVKRIDRQLEIAGNRIEPQYIEIKLKNIPGIEDAFVTKVQYRLVALLCLAQETVTVNDIRNRLTSNNRYNSADIPTGYYQVPARQLEKIKQGEKFTLAHFKHIRSGNNLQVSNEIEEAVLNIWRECFGREEIEIDVPFIELGGYSLLLTKILKKITLRFSIKISPKNLPENFTIKSLSKYLLMRLLYSKCFIQPGNPQSTNIDLFCIYPLAGAATSQYTALANNLGPQVNAHVLKMPLLLDDNDPSFERYKCIYQQSCKTNLIEIAKAIKDEIVERLTDATRPIHLIGWSFGAVLAYEIASQLVIDNYSLGVFVIVDGQAPGTLHQFEFTKQGERLQNIVSFIATGCGVSEVIQSCSFSALRDITAREQIEEFFAIIHQQIKKQPVKSKDIEMFSTLMFIAEQHMLATYDYLPKKKIDLNAICYIAEQLLCGIRECKDQEWLEHVNRLQLEEIPDTNHFNILESRVLSQHLSKQLRAYFTAETTLTLPSWQLPAVSANYYDRDVYTQRVEQAFAETEQGKGKIVVLQGIGGVGKTRFVVKYISLTRDYKFRAWLYADNYANLRNQLFQLAVELRIVKSDVTINVAIKKLMLFLQKSCDYLLVFDNANELTEIQEYLADLKGHVLITSRSKKWGEISVIHMNTLGEEDGIGFIQSQLKRDYNRSGLSALLKCVGGLPLGIMHAVSLLNNSDLSITKYIEQFNNIELVTNQSDSEFDESFQTIAKSWQRILDILRFLSPVAVQVAYYFTVLSADRVPLYLLEEMMLHFHHFLTKDTVSFQITAILSLLDSYKLIDFNGEFANIHRVLQAVILSELKNNSALMRSLTECSTDILISKLRSKRCNDENWSESSACLPHAERTIQIAIHTGNHTLTTAKFLNQIITHQIMLESIASARNSLRQLESILNELMETSLTTETVNEYLKYLKIQSNFCVTSRSEFLITLEKLRKFHDNKLCHQFLTEEQVIQLEIDIGKMYLESPNQLPKNSDEMKLNLNLAVEWLQKAEQWYKERGNTNNQLLCCCNLGTAYWKLKNFEKALEIFNFCVETCIKDEALSAKYISYCYGSLASIYLEKENPKGDLDLALKITTANQRYTLEFVRNMPNKRHLSWDHTRFCTIYARCGNFEAAEEHYQKFLDCMATAYPSLEDWPEPYLVVKGNLERDIAEEKAKMRVEQSLK